MMKKWRNIKANCPCVRFEFLKLTELDVSAQKFVARGGNFALELPGQPVDHEQQRHTLYAPVQRHVARFEFGEHFCKVAAALRAVLGGREKVCVAHYGVQRVVHLPALGTAHQRELLARIRRKHAAHDRYLVGVVRNEVVYGHGLVASAYVVAVHIYI